MTQVNVPNAKEKTSGNLPHRCQLAKPGDLQLIRNAEEGRSRFLIDIARGAAKHLIKGSHTYTHTHASKHTKELSRSKIPMVAKFSRPEHREEWKDGRAPCCRSARPRSGSCSAAPGPWDALGPNPPKVCTRSPQPAQLQTERRKAPIPAPAPAASCTARRVQNLVPQQLRAQDFWESLRLRKG